MPTCTKFTTYCKHCLTRKYALNRNGLWALLFGLMGATISALVHRVPL